MNCFSWAMSKDIDFFRLDQSWRKLVIWTISLQRDEVRDFLKAILNEHSPVSKKQRHDHGIVDGEQLRG
jgi:hypothetical protein